MADPARLTLTTVSIGAPDPGALARFYRDLLGWEVKADEPNWVLLRSPDGGVGLSFQTESGYARPFCLWLAQ
jgi:catechol 2,3-dioxygenase-like lactoylglutathione lyase family enzyme